MMNKTSKRLEAIRLDLSQVHKNSTLIISTNTDKDCLDFELYRTASNEYKLYIAKYVRNISNLLFRNKNIERIIFNNWDSSNIEIMIGTFADMTLTETPDFSKQDFSSVYETTRMFYKTKVDGKFNFTNHTLTRLEFASGMFENLETEEIEIDLGNVAILEGSEMLVKAKANTINLKFKTENNRPSEIRDLFASTIAQKIDISDWELRESDDIMNLLNDLKTNEIIMPNTISTKIETIGKISSEIGKIYCSKEWGFFLKNLFN